MLSYCFVFFLLVNMYCMHQWADIDLINTLKKCMHLKQCTFFVVCYFRLELKIGTYNAIKPLKSDCKSKYNVN